MPSSDVSGGETDELSFVDRAPGGLGQAAGPGGSLRTGGTRQTLDEPWALRATSGHAAASRAADRLQA
jgi:hypothetical protein